MIPEISRKGWQKQNLTRQMALKTRLWFLLNINPTTIQHSYGKWPICKWCILIRTSSFLQLCEIARGTACKHPETNPNNLLVSGLPAMGMENQPRKKNGKIERIHGLAYIHGPTQLQPQKIRGDLDIKLSSNSSRLKVVPSTYTSNSFTVPSTVSCGKSNIINLPFGDGLNHPCMVGFI